MRALSKNLFSKGLREVYSANIFFSLHGFLVLYINSSFIAQYVGEKAVGFLFALGSLLNIVLMMMAPRMIARVGIHAFSITVVVLEAVAMIGLIISQSVAAISFFFILHQAMLLLIIYILDLFLERATRNEAYTGRIRSIYLTVSNVVLVASPLIAGAIASATGSFIPVYMLSLAFLVPLFCHVVYDLPRTGIGDKHADFGGSLVRIWKSKSIRGIVLARFILEFFYAWMVIYMAIHLNKNLGFGWDDIGILFSIMLLPFVIFELPLGALADRKTGEKEILAVGFIVAAIATAFVPLLKDPIFVYWAILLFSTRIGASFAEIGTESYFFKHVNARDTGIVSIFRMIRPFSYLIAPALVSILLIFIPLGFSFFILSFVVALGLLTIVPILDTK